MKITYTINGTPVELEGSPEELSKWVGLEAQKVRDRVAAAEKVQDKQPNKANPYAPEPMRPLHTFRHRSDAILQILFVDGECSAYHIWATLTASNVVRLIGTLSQVQRTLYDLHASGAAEKIHYGTWGITSLGRTRLEDAPYVEVKV